MALFAATAREWHGYGGKREKGAEMDGATTTESGENEGCF